MLRYFFNTAKEDAELKKLTEQAVLKKLRKILPLIDIKELQYENGLMTIQNNPPEELLRESRAITANASKIKPAILWEKSINKL